MPTDAEVTASERESYRLTVEAQDKEIARLKAERDRWRSEKLAGEGPLWDRVLAAEARCSRLRSRLARVLRVEAEEMTYLWTAVIERAPAAVCMEWMTHRGGAWSSRTLSTPSQEDRRG